MVTYQRERWAEFYPDADELFRINNAETNLFGLELEVDERAYEISEKMGNLIIFTMRDQSELVGYCAFIVYPHSHHRSSLHAHQDVLYIKEGKRGKCLPFLNYCDGELKKSGVNFIHQSAPAINDWSPVLKRMGYVKMETIYVRSL